MKKMVSCLTALALLASVPTAAVFAADTTAATTTEAAAKEDNLSELAVSKMKDMNFLFGITDGAESDSKELVKVSDERFKTIASVKTFITDTCTGNLRDELLESCGSCLVEKDGALYYRSSGRFYYTFLTDNGVVITDKADDNFLAVTQKSDEMNDYGRVSFELEDGKWKVSSYEFGFFTVNKSTADLEGAAYIRIFHLQSILELLAYGAPEDSKDKITVDGKTYGKAKDDLQSMSLYSMETYISENCTGELRDDLVKQIKERYVEKDDVLYAVIGARGAYDFNISDGVTVSKVSADGFTATTVEKSDKDGYGRVVLAADGGKWLVKSYEFVTSNDAAAYSLGDVDKDGNINAVDASSVLSYYALVSTNKEGGFDDNQKLAADVNKDGTVNAIDASCILSYYAYISTNKEAKITIEEFLKK